jgi:hypothetical protein
MWHGGETRMEMFSSMGIGCSVTVSDLQYFAEFLGWMILTGLGLIIAPTVIIWAGLQFAALHEVWNKTRDKR